MVPLGCAVSMEVIHMSTNALNTANEIVEW